mmetsp:Transcript_15929/g.20844  ORF Transcript_15929/g.20844 Transcript_15929/m.20844 type:complete len:82 (+) Transcript_15929:1071-1316(+)
MSGDILRIRNLMQYGERKLINFPRDSERLRGFGLADKDAEQPSITIIFSLLFAEDQNKVSFSLSVIGRILSGFNSANFMML